MDNYISYLKKVKGWADERYRKNRYVFTQDGAPSHTVKKTQNWCKVNMADFWQFKYWPPSSPDGNVLDYAVWA